MPRIMFLELPFGAAVLKGHNSEFLSRFNAGLAAIRADGTWDRINKSSIGRSETFFIEVRPTFLPAPTRRSNSRFPMSDCGGRFVLSRVEHVNFDYALRIRPRYR